MDGTNGASGWGYRIAEEPVKPAKPMGMQQVLKTVFIGILVLGALKFLATVIIMIMFTNTAQTITAQDRTEFNERFNYTQSQWFNSQVEIAEAQERIMAQRAYHETRIKEIAAKNEN